MTERTQPITALASSSLSAPRRLINDPRELDDEQLLEIGRGFHARATTIGAVGATVTAAVAVALSSVVWFAAIALIPAAISGYAVSNRMVSRGTASRLGVTQACLRRVEVSWDVVKRDRDVTTLTLKDWFRTDWTGLLGLLRAELELDCRVR
jgi:hypothetical protein